MTEYHVSGDPIRPTRCKRDGDTIEMVVTGEDMNLVLEKSAGRAPILSETATNGSCQHYVMRTYREEHGVGKLTAERAEAPGSAR